MHCSLFIPDFSASESAVPEDRLASAETLIARGRRKRGSPVAPEAWLLGRFGAQATRGSPVAPYTLLADGGSPEGRFWMRADPVHLSIGLHSLRFDGSALDVSRAEADALSATLNRHFGDALVFHPLQPERWYISLPSAPDVDTTAPAAARGIAVGDALPSGRDAARFRALLNEAQMLLHEHPVNAEREARGAPGVNSVWFWGGGLLGTPQARPYSLVIADDPLARGLARAAGVAERPLPRNAVALRAALPERGVALVVLDGRGPDLERDWFEPLLAALRNGEIGMLSLHLSGRASLLEVETVRSDLRRFWRTRKPVGTWFA
jgi:hypothetical protein